MTTIDRLRVLQVPVPLVRPFVTNIRRAVHLDVVLVEATDSDGRIGWGEAATSWRVTGESPHSVAAAVATPLGGAVLGRELAGFDLGAHLRDAVWGNAAARSAVECAVLDVHAQRADVPLATMLNPGATHSQVRTDMTLSAAATQDVVARAIEHVAEGFRCLKLKATAAMDAVAVVQAVRDAVGDAVSLRVDANQAWETETAIRIIRECEDLNLGLEFVEQPVRAHDLDGLARVTAGVATPIMADESARTADDVREIVQRNAASLINIKLAKTGGITEALEAASIAQEAGLGVVFGCMMESQVGLAATAHLAAALAPDVVHDLDAALWLGRAPINGGPTFTAHGVRLPASAGLGFAGLAAEATVLVDIRARAGGGRA